MKTILYNPQTKDCTSTKTEPGSKRFDELLAEGYIIVGSVRGRDIVVMKYSKNK